MALLEECNPDVSNIVWITVWLQASDRHQLRLNARYLPRCGSQTALFAVSALTSIDAALSHPPQWMPSALTRLPMPVWLRGTMPAGCAAPDRMPNSLKRRPSSTSCASKNTPAPEWMAGFSSTMLLAVEPRKGTRPREGFSHDRPSVDSAYMTAVIAPCSIVLPNTRWPAVVPLA